MILLEDFIQYIQIILTPIAMISGVGIISLLTQTRYGRVVDSSRQLNREKLSLFRFILVKKPIEVEHKLIEKRIENIDQQLNLLIKRGGYLKTALFSLLTGIFSFIATSTLVLLQEILHNIFMSSVTIFSFLLGMVLLVIGGSFILIDLMFSHKAVLLAINSTKDLMKMFE
jgi:hypothetical protein